MGDLEAANAAQRNLPPEKLSEMKRKAGKEGMKKLIERTTPEQRKEWARRGALKRWAKVKEEKNENFS